MVAQHLKKELDRYHFGDKLRQLRLRRKMGLVELSKHTGLSPALLSKLEHGKLYPTLPTLSRIALVFSVGLEHFFSDERQKHLFALARKKERLKFPEAPGLKEVAFQFESLDYPATEVQFVSCGFPEHPAGKDARTPAFRRGIHLCVEGPAGAEDRAGHGIPGSGRFTLF